MTARYLFAFILILTFSGCMAPPQRMYSGPQLEPDKESKIRTQETGTVFWTYGIMLVDGKRTQSGFKNFVHGWVKEVTVLPGKHDIRLMFHMGGEYTGDFWVVTCPGKTYVAKFDNEYGFKMWFEDEETGKRVGGIEGSADEPKEKNVPCDGEKRL